MARSSYIYVVFAEGSDGQLHQPLGTFTVKHEMETWLQRQTFRPTILRYRDGNPDLASPPTLIKR